MARRSRMPPALVAANKARNLSVIITFRVTSAQRAALIALAERKEVTLSCLLRQVIRDYLDKARQAGPPDDATWTDLRKQGIAGKDPRKPDTVMPAAEPPAHMRGPEHETGDQPRGASVRSSADTGTLPLWERGHG